MMLRLAALLALLPLAVPAQGLNTPFEQPAPLNQEDGTPFPLGPDGQPIRPDMGLGGRAAERAPASPFGRNPVPPDNASRERRQEAAVAASGGALLRGLDKVSGVVTDLDLSVGETVRLGRLSVTLGECRYPVEDPSGDAFAFLRIEAEGLTGPAFEGWMIASSPALSALDHPRYDVWVMRCRSS
jgi:hypothetical protein